MSRLYDPDVTPIATTLAERPRILVVEDSFMTARSIARQLLALGAEVLGPVATVAEAMRLLDGKGCTGAVLDINLGHETSEPVAWRLQEQALPFFFISGYASPKTMLQHQGFRARTLLAKPIEPRLLTETVDKVFRGDRPQGHPPS